MKPAATPLRILLVEDDELFCLGLRMRLQQETGLEIVAEAEDGETAVELANRYHFAVSRKSKGKVGSVVILLLREKQMVWRVNRLILVLKFKCFRSI